MTITSEKIVLLITADDLLRDTLGEQLKLNDEFLTKTAGTGAEGLELSKSGSFDLILLDANLPDLDGRDVCKRMRRYGLMAPIIILTDQNSAADPILRTLTGVNDSVTKPFKLATLLDRMRSHLRKQELGADEVFSIGPYSFQPSMKLMVDELRNRKVRLTEKEAAILTYLYRTRGRIAKRETLLDEVWGYNATVTTHTLETHVYRLRQKIEPDPSKVTILVTDSGGYRLVS
tara:strand:+ start:33 stop:728 length:696 start_codon:yes stop_codon:yes gene_type:complete